MPLRFSSHARDRMAERGIAEIDVETALLQPIGGPVPGQPGTVLIDGFAPDGRILRVCVRDDDYGYVITAYWR